LSRLAGEEELERDPARSPAVDPKRGDLSGGVAAGLEAGEKLRGGSFPRPEHNGVHDDESSDAPCEALPRGADMHVGTVAGAANRALTAA
jgi:hypothetical protein